MTIAGKQCTSTHHFKQVFDQSLAILCEGAGSSQVSRRLLPLHIDVDHLRKRALSDAANALSMLWKVSGSKGPKLGNCAFQPVK